jgi:hypothetical protein
MDASAYMHDGSDPNKISPAKTRKGGTPGMFGSEMDGDGGEFYVIIQNVELDILRLSQRVSQLEKALPHEMQ